MDRVRELIKEKLDEHGLDMAAVSKAIGKSHSYLQQYFARGVPAELKEAQRERLAPMLGLSPDELRLTPREVSGAAPFVHNEARPAPRRAEGSGALRIPEYDVRPQAGVDGEIGPMETNGDHAIHPIVAEWMIPGDYLRAFVSEPGALRIVRVAGDSMEPEYPAGERVAVDTSHTIPSPPGVYVLWDGFGLVLKRVEIILGAAPPSVRISSINPAYPPYERLLSEIRVQGRVIGKWTWR